MPIKYIKLYERGDRFGSQLHNYIYQIVYAVYNTYYIKYEVNLPYIDNIFMRSILDYVDQHNSNFNVSSDTMEEVDIGGVDPNIRSDMFYLGIQSLFMVNSDIYSYFKKNIYISIQSKFLEYSVNKNYSLPFNPSKTILVHLRLDDVRSLKDYDGSVCGNYYRDKINNNENIGFAGHFENGIYNRCAPLSYEKITNQIAKVKAKYPDNEVIILTNPGEQHILPYRYIQNNDLYYDLFLLCSSNIVILARSCFSLSSLFFGNHSDVYLPLYGFPVSCGLNTKYDNCTYNYFF